MRYLAIDHGEKRTGLAIGDASETLVSPHSVIETSNEQELLNRILAIVKQERIEAVVLGLPFNMDGSEGPRASRVRRFAEQFIQRGGCPVLFHDERLTSFEAEHLAAGLELTRKKKKKRLDAIAAAAILNSFLEHKRKTQERKAVHVCRVKTMEELTEQTLQCFMDSANQAIEKRERFWAAISGGQTPLPFFRKLSEPAVSSRLEWNKIHLFWLMNVPCPRTVQPVTMGRPTELSCRRFHFRRKMSTASKLKTGLFSRQPRTTRKLFEAR
jgi:putative Holliday junction resolvase